MTTGVKGNQGRQHHHQLTHYIRKAVAWDDAGVGANDGILAGVLPAGAIVLRSGAHVSTPFNAGTTNVLTFGSAAGSSADLLASGDVDETSAGLTTGVAPTSGMIGPLAADTEVFVKYAFTGANPSAGLAQVFVEYIVDNDG